MGVDIWNIAHEVIKPHLSKGLTVYYEIVGFLPTGGYIQKNLSSMESTSVLECIA